MRDVYNQDEQKHSEGNEKFCLFKMKFNNLCGVINLSCPSLLCSQKCFGTDKGSMKSLRT